MPVETSDEGKIAVQKVGRGGKTRKRGGDAGNGIVDTRCPQLSGRPSSSAAARHSTHTHGAQLPASQASARDSKNRPPPQTLNRENWAAPEPTLESGTVQLVFLSSIFSPRRAIPKLTEMMLQPLLLSLSFSSRVGAQTGSKAVGQNVAVLC